MSELCWCEVPRDVVAVRGEDAESFLQGQCSQDIARIDVATSAWTFLLQPTGKVDVLARVHRINDAAFVLDTEGGWGQALADRLNRFRIRVKADVAKVGWRVIALRGPGAAAVPDAQRSWWGRGDAGDLLGPDIAPPPEAMAIDRHDLERLRVEAGWPAMGSELTTDTIPAESGVVPEAVSFTKGCFTGQELVARIDSRGGNVPRHLRVLRVPTGAALVPGARLDLDGKDVGWVTSVAGDVGLGYVARAVEPPATVDADGVAVTVTATPQA